jgi:hypothetical protein
MLSERLRQLELSWPNDKGELQELSVRMTEEGAFDVNVGMLIFSELEILDFSDPLSRVNSSADAELASIDMLPVSAIG